MTIGEWFGYKFHAARTLWRMVRWLSNWPEVWSRYRHRQPLPPLQFRSGVTLHHGPNDSPIALLHEVFGDRQYRRHLHVPIEGVMIDLGANVGAVSLDWATRSRSLRIHAYEPNPATNNMLRYNIQNNGLSDRVIVHDEAVGRESGELQLLTAKNSMTSTGYGEGAAALGAIAVRVPLIDLNEVVRRVGSHSVSLLKMDTEGAEADTLEGASRASLDAIQQIILEYHNGICPDAEARCRRVLERACFRCLSRPTTPVNGLLYAWRPER